MSVGETGEWTGCDGGGVMDSGTRGGDGTTEGGGEMGTAAESVGGFKISTGIGGS